MTVPSEIVEYIDKKYRWAQADEVARLGPGDAPTLNYLMSLLEKLPDGIITLKGEDHAQYGESVSTISHYLKLWEGGNGNVVCESVTGRGPSNPVSLIRKHLATLQDDVIAPATSELKFITDKVFSEALRLDISGAKRSFDAADWKGCTVVAGSIVEALLLWAVDEHEKKSPGAVAAAIPKLINSRVFSKKPPNDWNEWGLHQLTEVCAHFKIIGDTAAAQCRVAKDFRNLIHPGRTVRTKERCTRGTAHSALGAMHLVVDALS